MRRLARRLLVAACLAGALVTWNAVFDAHVSGGARDYVERQERFFEGRGPKADMDAVVRSAVSSGLRWATLWSLLPLLPVIFLVVQSRRSSRHHP